jgi:lysophospholipase L1-like esterase
MSQGTRAHQAALYVVFESPLQMLCDSPSHYMRTPEFTRFIAAVPTVWDETRALHASAGEYVCVARRNGENWYIGAITDWTGREMELDLGFLGEGPYSMTVLEDGVNANTYAADFRVSEREVSRTGNLTINLASGGGWAAVLTPVRPAAQVDTLVYDGPYYREKRDLQEGTAVGRKNTVMLGNSLTERGLWAEYFPGRAMLNRGIGGDCVSGMIARITPIVEGQPRAIFIMAGVNDLIFSTITSEHLLRQYERLIDIIEKSSPRTKIHIQSLLPVDEARNTRYFTDMNPRIAAFNVLLRNMAERRGLVYIDIRSGMERDGKLPAEYTIDGIHLNATGYEVWRRAIGPYVK